MSSYYRKLFSTSWYFTLLLTLCSIAFFNNCQASNGSSTVGEISRVYASAIIQNHGGRSDDGINAKPEQLYLNKAQFINYVSRLRNISANRANFSAINNNCSSLHSDATFCKSGQIKCFSSAELLRLVKSSTDNSSFNESVSASDLQGLCPIILQNLENAECDGFDSTIEFESQADPAREHLKPSSLEVWGYGFLFVTVISLSSVFGAVLLPLMGKAFYHRLLMVLIGLAVGSLSGSAAFHLIPQAFGLLNETGNHRYLTTSLLVLCGIYLFFMVERFLRIYIQYCERKRPANLKRVLSDVEVLRYTPTLVEETTKDLSVSSGALNTSVSVPSSSHSHPVILQKKEKKHHHEHHLEFKPGQDSPIATVAWMIVFGDGLHNFIDGLSIGAGFNQSVMTGISISVAVVCEELPHELGDMAILLNSGMTMKQALVYNFLSACTCYVGLIVGTLLGELAEASDYIFALAGGAFFYISLVDMIPEMNEEVENASRIGVWEALKVIGLQNLGWITGTAILFALAYYTDQIAFQ